MKTGLRTRLWWIALLLLTPGALSAYPNYHDPTTPAAGYCAACHPGFSSRGPTHDLHVPAFTLNCNLCHAGADRNNPFTMWSVGDGSASSNFGCGGCHGVDYGETIRADYNNGSALFALSGLRKASGYGLRKQHLARGVTVCLDCHADVLRCFVKPENAAPPNYSRMDVNVFDPCSSEDSTPEQTEDAVGLDNDGDGRVDQDDPDCNAALPTTPGEAGSCANSPLMVTGFDRATGTLTVGYGLPCSSTNAVIHYGSLTHAALAAFNYTGQVCSAGAGGTATFNPGTDSFFFIVAGSENAAEGSYGQGLSGTDATNPARRFYVERPGDPSSGVCGVTLDLVTRCD
jgi:hypothetical protein